MSEGWDASVRPETCVSGLATSSQTDPTAVTLALELMRLQMQHVKEEPADEFTSWDKSDYSLYAFDVRYSVNGRRYEASFVSDEEGMQKNLKTGNEFPSWVKAEMHTSVQRQHKINYKKNTYAPVLISCRGLI